MVRTGAKLACISSLASPAGAAQHLVMRIRKRCADVTVVVGQWGQGAEATLHERIGADARTYAVSRLVDATERVRGSTPT